MLIVGVVGAVAQGNPPGCYADRREKLQGSLREQMGCCRRGGLGRGSAKGAAMETVAGEVRVLFWSSREGEHDKLWAVEGKVVCSGKACRWRHTVEKQRKEAGKAGPLRCKQPRYPVDGRQLNRARAEEYAILGGVLCEAAGCRQYRRKMVGNCLAECEGARRGYKIEFTVLRR